MIKLAASADTAIYENAGNLYILKRPNNWLSTVLFVTGLLGFLLLANGILQLFVFNKSTTSVSMGGTMLAVSGIFFLFIFWRIMVYKKKSDSIPPEKLDCVCIFDLAANKLLDGSKNVLASLDTVYITRQMQITSSSPKLVLRYNNKTLTIAKGNPFSAGIAAIEKVLVSKGIKKN